MKRSGAKKQPQNETVLYGVLGAVVLGCVVYIYFQFAAPTTSAPPAPPVVTNVAPATSQPASSAAAAGAGMKPAAATTVAQLDPALHMEAMLVTESLEYAGSGRNIFSPDSAPPPPRVMPAAAVTRPLENAPPPMVAQGPPPLPSLPPIDLKFFGTATTQSGKQSVFLLRGDDVYRASEGDVVARKYKLITIGAKSVVMEDMSNNNRQTLPLENP